MGRAGLVWPPLWYSNSLLCISLPSNLSYPPSWWGGVVAAAAAASPTPIPKILPFLLVNIDFFLAATFCGHPSLVGSCCCCRHCFSFDLCTKPCCKPRLLLLLQMLLLLVGKCCALTNNPTTRQSPIWNEDRVKGGGERKKATTLFYGCWGINTPNNTQSWDCRDKRFLFSSALFSGFGLVLLLLLLNVCTECVCVCVCVCVFLCLFP